ncbi:hypothetical protein ABIA25_000901 [Sinorhizobium fredii]
MDQQSSQIPLSHQLHALARRQRAAAARRFFQLALCSAVRFLLRGYSTPGYGGAIDARYADVRSDVSYGVASALAGQFLGALARRRDSLVEKRLHAVIRHQDCESCGGRAAGRGDVLAQACGGVGGLM